LKGDRFTSAGRQRAQDRARALRAPTAQPPLLVGQDHGPPLRIQAEDVGAAGDRWIEPFLDANRPALKRLDLEVRVAAAERGPCVELVPAARLGAVPLVAPATRRVAAGLLIEPRFGWTSVGAVLAETGFQVEPNVGGGGLVPGSAREVPPWVVAGPTIRRLQALLRRLRRDFSLVQEVRAAPRGTVDWNHYATRSVARAALSEFSCTFPDLRRDPWLVGTVMWTLQRLREALAGSAHQVPARTLLTQIDGLMVELGAGHGRRPDPGALRQRHERLDAESFEALALEAVGWVADERGLGGSRSLDGLAWDLAGSLLWEHWVAAWARAFGRPLGFGVRGPGETERRLAWTTPLQSISRLVPDVVLVRPDRALCLDAKFKPHLLRLAQQGWWQMAETLRDAHRADVHQALAYASLLDAPRVDTVLVYPLPPDADLSHFVASATLAAGGRTVRLHLLGLPMGFLTGVQREEARQHWSRALDL
jgi:hypothetical protein